MTCRDLSSVPRELIFCLAPTGLPLFLLLSFFTENICVLLVALVLCLPAGVLGPLPARTCDISMVTEHDAKLHGWHKK